MLFVSYYAKANDSETNFIERIYSSNIHRLVSLPCIKYTSTQEVTYTNTKTGSQDKTLSYSRETTGIISPDGKFRYEIRFTSGESAGVRWIVAYNGSETYVCHEDKSKELFIKRGIPDKIPYLINANMIYFPYSFIIPQTIDMDDDGSYLNVNNIADKKLWEKFISSSKKEKSDTEYLFILPYKAINGDDVEITSKIDNKLFLPITLNIANKNNPYKNSNTSIEWKSFDLNKYLNIMLPYLITSHQILSQDNTKYSSISKLKYVAILDNPSADLWQVDLNGVDLVYDEYHKTIIPSKEHKIIK